MGLQIKIRLGQGGIVQQDLVHRDSIGAQSARAVPPPTHRGSRGAGRPGSVSEFGIHQHLPDLRDGEQRFDDVLVEGLTRQQAVVLARDTLAVVAHGDKSKELRHSGVRIDNI